MRTVSKNKFYAYVLNFPFREVQQIGLNLVRYTDSAGKFIGMIIMHRDGTTYRIK
jgi:hypothetical protein